MASVHHESVQEQIAEDDVSDEEHRHHAQIIMLQSSLVNDEMAIEETVSEGNYSTNQQHVVNNPRSDDQSKIIQKKMAT